MLVGDITAALGLANDTLTLSQLIAYAPDLAVDPLEGLMRRLVGATEEIHTLREQGSRAVIEKLDQIDRAMDRVRPAVFGQDGYNSNGFMTKPAISGSRFDYSA
jgi:hypothetical protein